MISLITIKTFLRHFWCELSGSYTEHFKPDVSFLMKLADLSVGDIPLLHLNVDNIFRYQNMLKYAFRKKVELSRYCTRPFNCGSKDHFSTVCKKGKKNKINNKTQMLLLNNDIDDTINYNLSNTFFSIIDQT
jgi:hypothetical protein